MEFQDKGIVFDRIVALDFDYLLAGYQFPILLDVLNLPADLVLQAFLKVRMDCLLRPQGAQGAPSISAGTILAVGTVPEKPHGVIGPKLCIRCLEEVLRRILNFANAPDAIEKCGGGWSEQVNRNAEMPFASMVLPPREMMVSCPIVDGRIGRWVRIQWAMKLDSR